LNPKRYFFFPLLLLLFLSTPNYASSLSPVLRTVDGDTILVSYQGQQEKVRLIGVDTPETVDPRRPVQYYGKEASDFTKKMQADKLVRLEERGSILILPRGLTGVDGDDVGGKFLLQERAFQHVGMGNDYFSPLGRNIRLNLSAMRVWRALTKWSKFSSFHNSGSEGMRCNLR